MEGKVPDCSDYERYLFWKEISGLDMFFVPNLYSSHIKEGIWKVIHRFVAQVINQRGEGARFISGDDIDMMIYVQRGIPIDFMEVLTKRFESYKSDKSRNSGLGGVLCYIIGTTSSLYSEASTWRNGCTAPHHQIDGGKGHDGSRHIPMAEQSKSL
ncbi:hypothetical protein QQ045_004968 [Rhodiola kirilowii]